MKGYNDKVADEITKGFGALSLHGVLQVSRVKYFTSVACDLGTKGRQKMEE